MSSTSSASPYLTSNSPEPQEGVEAKLDGWTSKQLRHHRMAVRDMRHLQESLSGEGRNVALMAVSVEATSHPSQFPAQMTQIGIAILRLDNEMVPESRVACLKSNATIERHQIIAREWKDYVSPSKQLRVSPAVMRPTATVYGAEMDAKVIEVMRKVETAYDIRLIVHSQYGDQKILQGNDITALDGHWAGCVDIQRLNLLRVDRFECVGFEILAQRLGVHTGRLHVAGDDAVAILKCALELAEHGEQ